MGPLLLLYIVFATISLFVCFIHLFFAFRKNSDFIFLAGAVMSALSFIYYVFLVFCSPSSGFACSDETLMRYNLIFSQAFASTILGVLYHLLKLRKQLYIFVNSGIFWALILVSLILPNEYLFGVKSNFSQVSMYFGEELITASNGMTLWRILMDLTILSLAVSFILLLLKKLDSMPFRVLVIFFISLGIVILAALWDHLVDVGQIRQTYILPIAFFILFFILIIVPIIQSYDEVYSQHKFIEQESKWLHFINHTDFIVVRLNRMGQVEYINPYFFKLTGFAEEEVLGNDWFEFFIPPNNYYEVQGTFVEILSYEFHSHYLNPIITKQKEERMVKWFNIRTRDNDGNISGSMSLGVDVTEEMREKEALQQKLKEAEKLIRKLSEKIDKA